ncbi:MAG: hypothetical protein ABJO86_00585 [Lentilitoribacter sp.]
MKKNEQFKKARDTAGLTGSQAAKLLQADPRTIRKWEADKEKSNTARDCPDLTLKVLEWYNAGLLVFPDNHPDKPATKEG